MVWAIRIANAFGEFSPRGDFRGYRAALEAQFNADRPLDGDGQPYRVFSTYAYQVSEKFHAELAVRRPHEPPLDPVQPHEWPTEYVYEKVYKRRAAITEFPNRMYAVEDGLRALLDRLEPGVHHFRPIRVVLPKGVDHPIQHHMMVVGRYLSSFRLDQSDPGCLRYTDSTSPAVSLATKQYFSGIAMGLAEIGDAHFWHERHLRGATFYASDLLMQEVTKAGLRLPPHYKMKSV